MCGGGGSEKRGVREGKTEQRREEKTEESENWEVCGQDWSLRRDQVFPDFEHLWN